MRTRRVRMAGLVIIPLGRLVVNGGTRQVTAWKRSLVVGRWSLVFNLEHLQQPTTAVEFLP